MKSGLLTFALMLAAAPTALVSPVASQASERVGAVTECLGLPPTTVGTPGPDRLVATSGRRDIIYGRGGDDVIVGLGGSDRACGGPGDDILRAPRAFGVSLDGQAGADRLVASIANRMLGGTGNDTLVMTGFGGWLLGGPGADVMKQVGRALTQPPDPTACVLYSQAVHRVVVDLGAGRARGQGRDRLSGINCVAGTKFADIMHGSDGPELFLAGYGADQIDTRGGRDGVFGDPGADHIELGDGNDSAYGGYGRDQILGRGGNDLVVGMHDGDLLSGGNGDDRVHAGLFCDPNGDFGNGTVDADPNVVFGGPGDDYVTGDLGDDRVDGGPGNDRGTGGAAGHGTDVVVSIERTTEC